MINHNGPLPTDVVKSIGNFTILKLRLYFAFWCINVVCVLITTVLASRIQA